MYLITFDSTGHAGSITIEAKDLNTALTIARDLFPKEEGYEVTVRPA